MTEIKRMNPNAFDNPEKAIIKIKITTDGTVMSVGLTPKQAKEVSKLYFDYSCREEIENFFKTSETYEDSAIYDTFLINEIIDEYKKLIKAECSVTDETNKFIDKVICKFKDRLSIHKKIR